GSPTRRAQEHPAAPSPAAVRSKLLPGRFSPPYSPSPVPTDDSEMVSGLGYLPLVTAVMGFNLGRSSPGASQEALANTAQTWCTTSLCSSFITKNSNPQRSPSL